MSSKKSKFNLTFAIIFSIISAAGSVAVAFGLGGIVEAAENRDMDALWLAIGIMLAIWGAEFLISVASWRFRLSYIVEMLFLVKRKRMAFLFGRKLKTPAEDNNADLSFFTADVDILRNKYYAHQAAIVFRIASIIFSTAAMIWVSPIMTLAVVGVMVIVVLATAPFGKGLNRRTQEYSDATSEYVDITRECIAGQREIIAYDKQETFLSRHEKGNANVENKRMKMEFFETMANFVAGYTNFLMVAVIFSMGAFLVIRGDMTIGYMIIIVQLVQVASGPISLFTEGLNGMRSAKGLLKKAKEKAEPEPQKQSLSTFNKTIEIRDLGLKYEEDNYIVQGLNLTFNKGSKYAIFAPSGYGKTSVARALAMEFLEFDGSITIDGLDAREVDPRDYNRIVRYVRQDPYLFTDTALNNLTFFGDVPPKSEMGKALDITRTSDFLADEEALNRQISNNSGLSGGQKQRMVLARALLHKPKVLILDEITSGVDLETACAILKDLFADKDLTVIAITHENDENFQSLFDEIVRLDTI